ncbi:MAG: hypothetical protein E7Z87_02885 [Cyanobacteria bacterium SIG26]|nr:hypothetical protein [Cyanobacteria bacterium SIG26]
MGNFTLSKIILTFFLVLLLGAIILNYFNHTYIKAEFNKMDPMPNRMGVYYKGYKLGTTRKIRISKDFKTTYLYITLNQRGLELPKNITVKVKQYDDDRKFVDIIYPSSPMLSYIKNGDTIKGEPTTFNFDNISETNQQHIDDLSRKGENFLSSATKTTDSLTEMFSIITDVIEENRENIFQSTTSLKNSMRNIEDLSQKLNDEITRDIIKKSAQNIEITTYNFANSSKDLTSISGNFTKTSSEFNVLIPKLDKLIDTAQYISCNISDIVKGVKTTLQKRLGGAKLIFGQTIK